MLLTTEWGWEAVYAGIQQSARWCLPMNEYIPYPEAKRQMEAGVCVLETALHEDTAYEMQVKFVW